MERHRRQSLVRLIKQGSEHGAFTAAQARELRRRAKDATQALDSDDDGALDPAVAAAAAAAGGGGKGGSGKGGSVVAGGGGDGGAAVARAAAAAREFSLALLAAVRDTVWIA